MSNTTGNVTTTTTAAQALLENQLTMIMPGVLSTPFVSLILQRLHIDTRIFVPILGFISAILFAWRYVEDILFNQLGWFMCTLHVRPEDETYQIVSSWIASQPFSHGARSFVVSSTNTNTRRMWDSLWWWDDDTRSEEVLNRGYDNMLVYMPAPGNHYFWYRRRLLILRRIVSSGPRDYSNTSENELINISCIGRDPWILKALMNEAFDNYNKHDQNKQTMIYRAAMRQVWTAPVWQRSHARANRPLSTVILDEGVKKNVLSDIEEYLRPETRRWYTDRGIPYRRGYLLHGPPGTGKSSFSVALAGHFNMRIYMVSLSSAIADEDNLTTLFSELPRRCIVLLEDIDTAGLTHTREKRGVSEDGVGGSSSTETDDLEQRGDAIRRRKGKYTGGRLSLSGLLNILDGVASQEGRILIMTTNHVDKLDKALTRPGRVDMTIKFTVANKALSATIFKYMYGNFDNEKSDSAPDDREKDITEGENKVQETETDEKADPESKRIASLADDFASKLPENQFSPAEIQGYLLLNKLTPEKAVAGLEKWCEETLAEHAENRKKAEEEENKERERRKKKKNKKRFVAEEKQKCKSNNRKKCKCEEDSSDNDDSEGSDDDYGTSESDDEPRRSKKRRDGKKADKKRSKGDFDTRSSSSGQEDEEKKNNKNKTMLASIMAKQPFSSGSNDAVAAEEDATRPEDPGAEKTREVIATGDATTSGEKTDLVAPVVD